MTAPDTPRLAPLGHLGGDRAASERTLPDLLAEARVQEGAKALVLVGDRDPRTPPDRAREIADAIPDASLAIIPDCGHASTLEQPKAVNAALAEWASA